LTEAAEDDDLLKVASRPRGSPDSCPTPWFTPSAASMVARKAGDIDAQSAALRLVCRLVYDLGNTDAMASRTAELAALSSA